MNFSCLSVTAHGAKAAPSPSLGFLGWRRRLRSKGERERKKGASGMRDGEICQINLPNFNLYSVEAHFHAWKIFLRGNNVYLLKMSNLEPDSPPAYGIGQRSRSAAVARFETQKYWLWKRGKKGGGAFQSRIGGRRKTKRSLFGNGECVGRGEERGATNKWPFAGAGGSCSKWRDSWYDVCRTYCSIIIFL